MKPDNPFLVKGYVAPSYFCDREKESKALISSVTNGANVTLFALRRMGKTGLLYHVGHQLAQRNIQFIYTDIFNCENTKDLALKLGSSLLQQDTTPKTMLQWLGDVFRSVKPIISYDSLTGAPELSVEMITHKQGLRTLDDIFAYLKRQKKKYVWAIDEFQQITQFPEKNIEATLRTHIQHLHNVNFIFSGSRKDMLAAIFSDARRPFYQSTNMLELKEIEEKLYRKFIVKHFTAAKQKLTPEALDTIIELSENHTWYVQILCNSLYKRKLRSIQPAHVSDVLYALIQQYEMVYFNYRTMQTPLQWKVMKAIAHERKVYAPNAKSFIKEYDLGTAPSVNRALKSLIEQEHISLIYENVNTAYYRMNDVFLAHWLRSLN